MHDNIDICLQPDIVLSDFLLRLFSLSLSFKIISRNLSANDNEKYKNLVKILKNLKDNKKKRSHNNVFKCLTFLNLNIYTIELFEETAFYKFTYKIL